MGAATQDRRKSIVAGVLVPLAVFLAARSVLNSGTPTSIAQATSTPASLTKEIAGSAKHWHSASLDPMLNYVQLERAENERYEGNGRNIFRAQLKSESTAVTPRPAPAPPDPPEVVEPRRPAIRLKFFGFASIFNSPRKVFLSEGDDIFVGNEGQIVDRRYRITRIDSNSIDVEDLMDHSTYTLLLSG